MDFFEEMNLAIARDAARRGVRASADELQAFFGLSLDKAHTLYYN